MILNPGSLKNSRFLGLVFGIFFINGGTVLHAQASGDQAVIASPAILASDKEADVTVETFDFNDPFVSALPSKIEETAPIEDVSPDIIGPVEMTQKTPVAEEKIFDFSSLAVTGIIWGAAKPKAIINDDVVSIGKVFKAGDGSPEAEIIDISREGILFRSNGKEILMRRDGVIAHDKGEDDEKTE